MDNFFYNLNDKLNAIRDLPSTTPGQLNERDMSRAAKGYKKYDNTEVDEGLGDVARRVGGAVKRVAGKALDTLGHGSDQDLIKQKQRDMGATGAQVHGKKSMAQPNEAAAPMTAKQKSFAKLAPPENKITFADKIAGAKKEVDEMLGDVAANAMKQAMGGGRGRNAEVDEEVKSRKIAGSRYGGAKQVDKPEHDDTPKAKAKAGRPESDQLKPDWSAFGGNNTVKLGKHKGAVTKHEIGDKTPAKGQAADAAFKASEKSAKKVKEGPDVSVTDRGEYDQEGDMAKDDIKTIVRHAQALEKILGDDDNLPEWVQSKLTKIESMMTAVDDYMQSQSEGDKQQMVGEKSVSRKQQKFMGMVHAAQKGEKPASKEVAKVAKEMPKKEAEKFAKTKHKGLPEKKKPEGKTNSGNKASMKKEEVEETTTSGSVATTSAPAKGKGGMSFGQGIYDSFNREVESMISEGMTINMSMNSEGQGGPTKSLTVTATEEDAEQLAQMLSNAGIASRQMPGHGAEEMFSAGPMDHEESCESCGMQTCGCGDIEEALDENNPDWPTEPTGQEDNINYYDTDGLNGRKTTGQSTVPVLASQNDRQESYAEAEEDSLYRMMEMAGIAEAKGKKPDFLDVDKDGNKKEPFKKAVDDEKEEKLKEDDDIDADTTNKDLEESLMRQLSNFKK
jgi:hypothetical protein